MKKKLLTVMVTTLLLVTLVGCGKDSDTISDSTQENDVEVENEVVEDEEVEDEDDSETTEEGFMDTSMDGGAPVGETFDEATTEDTTTEEVVPVEVTFTLMSEDGSAVAYEGTVPEGLTLVSGDGTNHIEFAYDENPAVTVYLDGGADNNVLVVNERYINQSMPQYLEMYPLSEATETYDITSGSFNCDFTINGDSYGVYSASLNNTIMSYDTISTEPEYITWKAIPLLNYATGEFPENPFTITVMVDKTNTGELTELEISDFNYAFTGGTGDRLASDIVESFSN